MFIKQLNKIKMERLILTKNDYQIEQGLNMESKYSERFQPFVTEFLMNDFDYKDKAKIDVIRDVIYTGTLEKFIKEQALIKLPEIDRMPVTQEMKMNMIDVNSVFQNYAIIEKLFNSIRQLTPQIKAKIYSFDINEVDQLVLNDFAIEKISDAHTVYGNSKQLDAFNDVNDLLQKAKIIYEKTGVNVFAHGTISGFGNGKLVDCVVNPYAVLQAVKQ
jgi:hypothetical protein